MLSDEPKFVVNRVLHGQEIVFSVSNLVEGERAQSVGVSMPVSIINFQHLWFSNATELIKVC